MFSAIMSVWERDDPTLFKMALNSILNQTMLPSEFILVIDGSLNEYQYQIIDDTKRKFQNSGISFATAVLEENQGHAVARQTGLSMCKCKYVAICDADDLNHQNRFEKLLNGMLQNDKLAVIGSHVEETNLLRVPGEMTIRKVPLAKKDIYTYSKYRCPFNHMTVMLNKPFVNEVGGYKNFFHNEDYFLWFRMMRCGFDMANLDEVLVTAHQDSKSFQRRGGLNYFLSEVKIKRLYYQADMINFPELILQVMLRFMVQICMPPLVRRYVFVNFFRRS